MIRILVVISCVCLHQLLISLRKLLQSISGQSTCYSVLVSPAMQSRTNWHAIRNQVCECTFNLKQLSLQSCRLLKPILQSSCQTCSYFRLDGRIYMRGKVYAQRCQHHLLLAPQFLLTSPPTAALSSLTSLSTLSLPNLSFVAVYELCTLVIQVTEFVARRL